MRSIENIRTGKTITRKLPRRVSEMSKEVLEATLRKKRECNNKALQIIQHLVENTVDDDWFLDSLKFISDSHYQDITEERAITDVCGYPLCSRKLKNIPNQQYRISTRQNKVYDITERKNFCSNQCYKASSYLKRQLLTSPLWLRDKEEIPKFVLLPVHSTGGGVGEEVDIGQSNPLKEELKQIHKPSNSNDFTSISDFMKNTLSELSSDIDKAERKNTKAKQNTRYKGENTRKQDANTIINHSVGELNEERIQIHNEIKQSYNQDLQTDEANSVDISQQKHIKQNYETSNESKLDISDSYEDKTPNEQNKNNTIVSSESHIKQENVKEATRKELSSKKDASVHKKNITMKNKQSKKQDGLTQPITSTVIHIEKCLHEWFTIESMCFLFGEDRMKEIVSDKGECIKEYYKGIQNASWDPKIQEQYMTICRRLNLMELEENKFDENTQIPTKPVPDYEAIKEEGMKMELKVRAFFQGKAAFETADINSKTSTSNDAPSAVLPIVDLHAQKCLRRKIVRDRLNRVIPDILRTFGLSCDVTKDIRNLVATFTLEAHNINFQPLEWNLIGMVFIKMLSIKDMRLRILLDNEEVIKYITMMLMVFQQDGGYLDRLMGWLTDLDNLLRKQ
ncbi:hypothetical protein L9F63_011854 [Diploptera punctata]|uniref:RNA polymerase II subunit B1 CTD phosphatase RPAP2 homolog n=1 Tax=Diploptera punctata TaxID=6984 RepID=A0AAD8EP19_DIPPU|nr:hypothetical protein L9F63_011854 [Diploptera punctata]